VTVYVTNAEFRKQKARLTRAQNRREPLLVLEAVEKTLNEWDGKAWPDDWSRWARALDDAYFTFRRSVEDDEFEQHLPRWRAVMDDLR